MLSILTFFSTPILTCIFGDGSVEGEEWDDSELLASHTNNTTNPDPAEVEETEKDVDNYEIQEVEDLSQQVECSDKDVLSNVSEKEQV